LTSIGHLHGDMSINAYEFHYVCLYRVLTTVRPWLTNLNRKVSDSCFTLAVESFVFIILVYKIVKLIRT